MLPLENPFFVNYNSWFEDKDYRVELSSLISRNHSDENIGQIMGYGGGSSFDGLNYQNRAQNMDVMNRWKHFSNNEQFLCLLRKHKDVLKSAKGVFSNIEKISDELNLKI